MRHVKMLAAAMAVAAGTGFASASNDGVMDNGALRKAVAGKTVHLATPLGGLPINYRADGTMWGKAGSLAGIHGLRARSRPLVGGGRQAVSALEYLARRPGLLLHAAPAGGWKGALGTQRRPERRGNHRALSQWP